MNIPYKAAVLGQHDIEKYSLSPLIHNYFFEKAKISGIYSAIPVEADDLDKTLKKLGEDGYTGVNLTIPHKINAIKYIKELDKSAKIIGAINTVLFNQDGTMKGFNTDYYGFIENLNKTVANWNLTNNDVIIFGAGGASHAVIYGLQNCNVKNITICNRNDEKAEKLAKDFNCNYVKWENREKILSKKNLIINTTSAGMNNNPALDISLENSPENSIIYDIVYTPKYTPLIEQAIILKDKNFKIVYGLGMLLYQASEAFNIWFKTTGNVDKAIINQCENRLKQH